MSFCDVMVNSRETLYPDLANEVIGLSDDILFSNVDSDSPREVRQFVSGCGCPEQLVPRKDSNVTFRNLDHRAEYFPMVARTTPQAFFGCPPPAVRPRSPTSISAERSLNLPTRPSPATIKHEEYVSRVLNDPHDDLYDDSSPIAASGNEGAPTGDSDGDSDGDDDYTDHSDDDGGATDMDIEMDTRVPQNRLPREGRDVANRNNISVTEETRRDLSRLQVNAYSILQH